MKSVSRFAEWRKGTYEERTDKDEDTSGVCKVAEIDFVSENGIRQGRVEVGLEPRRYVVRQRLSEHLSISIHPEVYSEATYSNRGETSSQARLGTITWVVSLSSPRSAVTCLT